jgi:hypothetical protein
MIILSQKHKLKTREERKYTWFPIISFFSFFFFWEYPVEWVENRIFHSVRRARSNPGTIPFWIRRQWLLLNDAHKLSAAWAIDSASSSFRKYQEPSGHNPGQWYRRRRGVQAVRRALWGIFLVYCPIKYHFFISRLQDLSSAAHTRKRPSSPNGPPSVFSNDIYLGDNSGESLAFARDVRISGWTSVGDKLGGAYIGK